MAGDSSCAGGRVAEEARVRKAAGGHTPTFTRHPSDGNPVKRFRDLARVEEEQRLVGAGPDVAAAVRQADQDLANATHPAERHVAAGLDVPRNLQDILDAADDRLAAAEIARHARFVQMGEIQSRLLEAHEKAVDALKTEFAARLGTLADEAQGIYNRATETERRHPRRLHDRILAIGVERDRGVELATAYGTVLGHVIWHALTAEAYEGIVGKQRLGRSVALTDRGPQAPGAAVESRVGVV